jgi:hypothetical protein
VKAISSNAVHVDLDLAATLFGQLERATRRGRGIVRDSYGPGEQAAHDIVRAAGDDGSAPEELSDEPARAAAGDAERGGAAVKRCMHS